MISVPAHMSRFQFVRLSTLRVAQLIQGCTPRVEPGLKLTTTAQREVQAGKIEAIARP